MIKQLPVQVLIYVCNYLIQNRNKIINNKKKIIS